MNIFIVTGIIETKVETISGTFVGHQHYTVGVYVNLKDAESKADSIKGRFSWVDIEEHDVHGAKGWV